MDDSKINENDNSQIVDKEEETNLEDLEITADDTPEEAKEKAEKAVEFAKQTDEKNKQLFNRTKKAEGFEQVDGKWVKKATPPKKDKPDDSKETKKEPTPEAKDTLSTKDLLALNKADIHEDDLEEVLEYAKYKKISVTEALKTDIIKKTLAESVEKRQTADATSTGGNRSGSASKSGSKLLEKAEETGELPESNEGIDKLVDARYSRMKKK